MNPADTAQRARLAAWFIAVIVAVLLRTIALGRWPGINGDEAWYGVNVQEFLNGGMPFWHTGIGNPLNPIHSGLLLALSLLFEPSGALLRVPEVILGIAAVMLAYPLLWPVIGRRAALLATMLLAVAPATVAYSRLGWDPSGTPLLALLAVAAALRGSALATVAACIAAYFVHPTNLFLIPIVAALWAPVAITSYRNAGPAVRARIHAIAVTAAVIVIPLAAWAATRIAQNPETSLPSISMVVDRVTSPARWLARGAGFINLLSGASTVEHIAAPLSPRTATTLTALVTLLVAASLSLGWRVMRTQPRQLWLLAGMALAFIGFHIVAMDLALQPTLERYGMFMLVPMVIALSIALAATTDRFRAIGRTLSMLTVTILGAMTIGAYFLPIATRGGDAMATYRTGDVEPKRAALAFIEADRAAAPVQVIAEDWFLYWTLRYFAGPNGAVYVDPVPGASLPGGTRPRGAIEPARPALLRTYVVAYANSQYPAMRELTAPSFTAFDPIGRPVLHVYATRALAR